MGLGKLHSVSNIFGNSAGAAKLLQVRLAGQQAAKTGRRPVLQLASDSSMPATRLCRELPFHQLCCQQLKRALGPLQEAKERQKAEYAAGIKAQLAEREARAQSERSERVSPIDTLSALVCNKMVS